MVKKISGPGVGRPTFNLSIQGPKQEDCKLRYIICKLSDIYRYRYLHFYIHIYDGAIYIGMRIASGATLRYSEFLLKQPHKQKDIFQKGKLKVYAQNINSRYL